MTHVNDSSPLSWLEIFIYGFTTHWETADAVPNLNTLPGVFQPFFSQFPFFDPIINYINNFQWKSGEQPFTHVFWGFGFPFIYLATILLLQKLMKNRKEIESKTVIAIHNFILMVLSIIMFVGTLNGVIRRSLETTLFDTWCMPNHHHITGDLAFWNYVFYLSKFYELFDSVILALGKKKNLRFLHVYHHFIVIPLFWSYNSTYSIGHWMLVLTNTFVHIFMYYYFSISALGMTVWWKKYLTITQLIQFFIDLSFTWPLYPMTYIYKLQCSTQMWTIHFGQFIGFTFSFLFYQLYKANYNAPKKAAPKKAASSRPKKD